MSRQALLESAREIFSSRGYEGAGVREIAERASVNPALISYHFGGKAGLFQACLEDFGQQNLAMAERILQPAATLEEFRLRLSMFTEEVLQTYLASPNVVFMVLQESERMRPETDSTFQGTFRRVFGALQHFVTSARTKKLIGRQVDPNLATFLYFSMLVHLIRTDKRQSWHFDLDLREQADRARVIRQMTDLFLHGTTGSSS